MTRQPMTPELDAIVSDAYDVFGRYRIGDTLTVCHCNCCMTPEVERELVKTPVRAISADLLAEYTNSAHGWDDGPIAREMRYFLPRYFDLIAQGSPPDSMGLDICLRRLAFAKWRAQWPDREVEVIDRFFDALVRDCTTNCGLAHWPAGWKLAFDFTDVLTCIVTAHGRLDAALAAWDVSDDPGAALHMASLRERVISETNRTYLHSAYLEKDFDAEAEAIGAFLMRDSVDARLERAFFSVTDPRLQKILSDAMVR